MKAPSERHLEDWIVANQDTFTYRIGDDTFTLFDRIVGRQARFPSGICDLIGEKSPYLTLIELKATTADAKAVAQVMRYMSDMNAIWHETVSGMLAPLPDVEFWKSVNKLSTPAINGVLICKGLSDSKLEFACDAANILVLDYSFDGNDYTFSAVSTHTRYQDYKRVHADYSQGWLGDAIRRVANYHLKGGE